MFGGSSVRAAGPPPFSRRLWWGTPALLLVGLVLVGLRPAGGAGGYPAGGSLNAHPDAALASGPLPPLATILQPDGTLDPTRGFRGSLDPQGWQLTTGPGGVPRFVRAVPPPAGSDPGLAVARRTPSLAGPAAGYWDDRFGLPGPDGVVEALASTGSTLYLGGLFEWAGRTPARNIARWDAALGQWSALGAGISGQYARVTAVAVSGADVFVGGFFSTAGGVSANNIARWDESTREWHALGVGLNGSADAIAVSGSDVFVAGTFEMAGGLPVNHIARWNRTTEQWFPLGTGLTGHYGYAYALAISGNDVYVGGEFDTAGGGGANHIARWNGIAGQWFPLGAGVSGPDSPVVRAIAVSGDDVYVGGEFDTAGGVPANHIARWNASAAQWAALGAGVDRLVTALAIADSDVFVGGYFLAAGGAPTSRLARWDASRAEWSALGAGVGGSDRSVAALALTGSDLYVGGNFDILGEQNTHRVGRWDTTASQWHPLGAGLGLTNWARALGAGGSAVYAGGSFAMAGPVPANNVARWDAAGQWQPLGSGVSGGYNTSVNAIAVDGDDVYVGGEFTVAGGVSAAGIARWNAATGQWAALGEGVGANGQVQALAISGPDVYVGGSFTIYSANAANIARWNTTTAQWYALDTSVNSAVHALAVSGTDVYVGGDFDMAGGVSASHIARWDAAAAQWQPLGSGVTGGYTPTVHAVAVSAGNVYVGGEFTVAGGVSAAGIARWNAAAAQWSALGTGLDANGAVYAIAISGTDVYAGGPFRIASANAANIARWNPTTAEWQALADGLNSEPFALATLGSAVYTGGTFLLAGGAPSAYVALWHDPDAPTPTPTPLTPTDTPTRTATPTTTPTPTLACPPVPMQEPWVTRSPVPTVVAFAGLTSDGSRLYLAGGSQPGGPTAQFRRYHPATDTWTALAPLPGAVEGPAAVFAPAQQKVYVFGGLGPGGAATDQTQIYDPNTNRWAAGAPMPGPRYNVAAAYQQGKIYVVGGGTSINCTSAQTQVWEYDPATDTWGAERAPLPAPRLGMAWGSAGGHLYVGGGCGGAVQDATTLFDYAIASDSWTARRSLPLGLTNPAGAVAGGYLWVIGGRSDGSELATTLIYSLATDSWSTGQPLQQAKFGVAATALDEQTLLAVGGVTARGLSNLTERSEIAAWPGCASVTPPPSVTPPRPSPTPRASPSPCPLVFVDVPASNVFYPFVRCLACQGILSGYADGTFRPAANITRGQAAKIVANAAGYSAPIPPTQQTFTDVPPGSPFWVYVERVAGQGVISGYADGTFRPVANVTRGQLAKIAAGAAGYSEVIPPAQQTFADVPPTAPFWVYVERVALHGVVSGYADGTFRPAASVTRGQTAKILSNTFFPGCQPP